MTSGFINILKPPGMTSHDVVSFVRRTYGLKRVGHAGTLDPAAAGVLPVALGQSTRLIEYSVEANKSYRAELTLGYATDTGDSTGQVVSRQPLDVMPDVRQVEAVFQSLTGRIEQIPPMHSAIKIAGKKMYELARAGICVERKPRPVEIYQLSLIELGCRSILFDVVCSKGTYIRTLCSDIGHKLSIPAVMSFLVRTSVGSFYLKDALTMEEISAQPQAALLPSDIALGSMMSICLSDSQARAFGVGQTLRYLHDDQPLVRVYDQNGQFLGIGKLDTQRLMPVKVMPLA